MEENRTLIVVDDEPETLKGYAEFLAPRESAPARKSSRSAQSESPASQGGPSPTEKYNVLLAHSGEEALKIVESEHKAGRRIAAGFFDVKLEGGMDGLSTIAAIKKLDPEIHCVVVTAYHDRSVDEIHQLFGEEFKDQWDYLNKPFTRGEIVQKARQMVGSWNRRRKIEVMNRQLVQSERLAAVGQVARGIGHEFGNILLRIIGKTDLALMEKSSLEKIHDHLKVIMTAAERASVIVRNLQSFSKAEPVLRPGMIETAIDEALSLIGHELVRASVTVEKRYEASSEVELDTGGIAQVFLNLMINATHAMPDGGKLAISVSSAPGGVSSVPGVLARVADTGIGIPPEVLPRIFEFAFTTKGDRGSGLGLAVSKEIVEAHGGTLTVKSEVGKGTEFSIWIPRKGNR